MVQSRVFAKVLEYEEFRKFLLVLEKAKIACDNSELNTNDHFVDVTEMVTLGSSAQREVATTLLSRYACYLIVQNADPRKEIVAHGQTYFALQTRRQELTQLSAEDMQRLSLRQELRQHNSQLADAANNAGIKSPPFFPFA